MSQVLINQYLSQLDVLKKVGGTHRESVVREAFKDLLKGWDLRYGSRKRYRCTEANNDARGVIALGARTSKLATA